MFKSKSDGNKKGVTFNSFAKLISDSFFINKNITKLDFIGSTMISKSVLNGVIYVSNIQPSLSEMDDINSTLDRINLVDMIYLFTDDDSAEIYQNRYVNHTVTDSYVEINLKNGQIKRLNF